MQTKAVGDQATQQIKEMEENVVTNIGKGSGKKNITKNVKEKIEGGKEKSEERSSNVMREPRNICDYQEGKKGVYEKK